MIQKVKDRYKEYLKTRNGIIEYNSFKNILYTQEDTLIKNLCKNHIAEMKFAEEISICDVGAGDGKRIIQLVKYINKTFGSKINLDFIEQSGLMCDDFIQKQNTVSAFCKSNVIANEIEETELKGRYDLAFFIHSIFCFHNLAPILKTYEKLKDDGIIIVISNSGDSILAKLKEELDLEYEDSRYEISNLIEDLSKLNITFEEITFKTHWGLNKDKADEKLAIILDWLSLGEFKKLKDIEKVMLIQKVKGKQFITEEKEDRFSYVENEKVVIISKNVP